MTFTIWGEAIPQGSMRAFVRPGARHAAITSDNPRLKAWRRQVAFGAKQALLNLPTREQGLLLDAVRLGVVFYLPRPKSLPKKVTAHLKKPDCDKLVRGLNDALTGVIYRDDSQVIEINAHKRYADAGTLPRVVIDVDAYEFLLRLPSEGPV